MLPPIHKLDGLGDATVHYGSVDFSCKSKEILGGAENVVQLFLPIVTNSILAEIGSAMNYKDAFDAIRTWIPSKDLIVVSTRGFRNY